MIKKLVGLVGVVVLVLVGVGVWYFAIRDDSVEKDTVGCDPEPCEASTVDSVDGTWAVVPADSSTSLVISETIGGVADHQVEGNTDVTGTIEISGSQVTDASFTADMTTLEFTDAPPGFDVANRARAMERTGLETAEFPEATFVLSEPIELGDVTSGEIVTARATGDTVQVTPSDFVPIVLADHEMEVDAPGFIADIGDEGSFDFDIVLEQA